MWKSVERLEPQGKVILVLPPYWKFHVDRLREACSSFSVRAKVTLAFRETLSHLLRKLSEVEGVRL